MFVQNLIENLTESFVAGLESRGGEMPSYGFDEHGRFKVVTREPQDPGRSWNGGDYCFVREYRPRAGKAQEFSSCDFWQPEGRIFRFRSMSRKQFMRHVRVARELAVRLYRRGVRADAWGLFVPGAFPAGHRVTLRAASPE